MSAVVAILGTACSPPTAREIVGVYTIEYSYGRETLVLEPSGVYSQTFVGKNAPPVRNAGTWEMDGRELVLRDAMDPDDGFGNPGDANRRGEWYLVPARAFGRIVIPVNPDRKERYEKQR